MSTAFRAPPSWLTHRARRAGAAVGLAALSLTGLSLQPSVAGAHPGTTSTTLAAPGTTVATIPAATTTTTSTPPHPTTTSTVPASTTTTTKVPLPRWTAKLPPPPPPAPVNAPPAELAQASRIEQQIVADTVALDVLSDQYNKAVLAAGTASRQLSQAQDQLMAAEANEAAARHKVDVAQQDLRRIAVDAYVGLQAAPPDSRSGSLVEAYTKGLVRSYSKSAVSTAMQKVRQLHGAVRALHQVQQAVRLTQAQAAADSASKAASELRIRNAAQAAVAQQQRLLTTLSSVRGDLVGLVAFQFDSAAVAAYNHFTTVNVLDFQPAGALPPASPQTAAAMRIVLAQIGKPYVWGGSGPDVFDCSGLMQWSWAQVGIQLPRVAADQQAWAVAVPISQLQPGDLVFFGNPAHHVGMYIGNGMMVNAPHTGADVSIAPVWASDLAGFGRVHT